MNIAALCLLTKYVDKHYIIYDETANLIQKVFDYIIMSHENIV
jgi:hypothetical protein